MSSLLSVTPALAEGARAAFVPASGGLQAGAWLLVALPLLGAAVLLLGGRRDRPLGPLLAVGLSWAAFVYAALLFVNLRGYAADQRARDLHLFSWVPAGSFRVDAGLRLDPLSLTFVLLVTFVGIADPRVLDRLHGARRRPPAVLRLPQPVRRLDAAAGARRHLPAAVRRLGGRGAGVLPADRLLEPQPVLRHGGEEGVRRQPGRRLRAVHRDHADVRRVRHGVLLRGARQHRQGLRGRCSPPSA